MPAGDKIEKLNRKPQVPFTAELKERYLELFRHDADLGGRKYLCAEAVGVSASTIDYHVKYDPEFGEALDDARQSWIDENLFIPALRRARDGVSKPIIGGKFKDEIVTTVQEYSDSLMLAMLRAHKPEFRETGNGKGGGVDSAGRGGVMIVPAAPANIEEWQDLFGKKAQGKTGAPEGS